MWWNIFTRQEYNLQARQQAACNARARMQATCVQFRSAYLANTKVNKCVVAAMSMDKMHVDPVVREWLAWLKCDPRKTKFIAAAKTKRM